MWKGNLVVTLSLEAPREMSDSHVGRDLLTTTMTIIASGKRLQTPGMPSSRLCLLLLYRVLQSREGAVVATCMSVSSSSYVIQE